MTDSSSWTAAAAPSTASQQLSRELKLPDPIAQLLIARGYADVSSATKFLNPSLSHLHDPYAMHGMREAVERIRQALLAQEPILIYGDYDVDGTVATVLLKTACERTAAALGVTPDIRYHIPHRLREGYGMRESRIADAAAEGVRLVVSVDTGIRAHAAAEEAARLGLDLIVTDHHLPDELNGPPRALAVLNPNQRGCEYPCKDLCGAAVAFKLAQALLQGAARDDAEHDRLRSKTLPSFLKLLAIATIADSVPLIDENRTIASIGLRELRSPAQPGLRALMELAGIDTSRPVSATDVGFRLAPRLNAAGRMEIASDVVELFLSRDPVAARALAEKLHRLNDDRRATEANALREIEQQIEALLAAPDGLPACLVLDDHGTRTAGWHRGVVGILASRVAERTGRPALVLAHEDGTAHGSGRSVPGFHLLDALTSMHEQSNGMLFSRFGGHAHAVGFALPSTHVPQLRDSLAGIAASQLGLTPVAQESRFDLELRFVEVTPSLLAVLEQLAPFGLGNPDPIFVTRGVRLLTPPRILADRHVRLSLQDHDGGARFSGVAWGRRTSWAELSRQQSWAPGDCFDLAYHLRRNWHPDFGGWELEIIALERRP
ncbi:MAG TPA: single-stranded-DNA-specific exonuclease RecJ [Acidobacteriaceae bacterium]|nr:single-stranded-DNA-specific exonuclease RecJ [Acidobacteriaceae bacterium]